MRNPFTRYEVWFDIYFPLVDDDWRILSRRMTRKGAYRVVQRFNGYPGIQFDIVDSWERNE